MTNGSVYHGDQLGVDATHYLQSAGLRLVVPIKRGIRIGADALVFFRDSHYAFMDEETGLVRLQDIHQNNPQLRVYLALNSVR